MSIGVILARTEPEVVTALDEGQTLWYYFIREIEESDDMAYVATSVESFQSPGVPRLGVSRPRVPHSRVPRAVDLRHHFAMMTYQLSPTYRNPTTTTNPWTGEARDERAAVVAGMRPVEGALSRARRPPHPPLDPHFPLRTSNPEEVKQLSEVLDGVSAEEFLKVRRREKPKKPFLYSWRSLDDPDLRRTFGDALANLKVFYRAAAEADQAMLHRLA